ncbi:TPA: hypothetical protein ACH3X3_012037 [Trebouxia sp. C0006]
MLLYPFMAVREGLSYTVAFLTKACQSGMGLAYEWVVPLVWYYVMPVVIVAVVVIFWQDLRLTYKWALKLGRSCVCINSDASAQRPKPGGTKPGGSAEGTANDSCSNCSDGSVQSCSNGGIGSFSSSGSSSRHNISDRQQMSLAAEVYGFLSAEVHARHVPRHSNQLHGRYLCL